MSTVKMSSSSSPPSITKLWATYDKGSRTDSELDHLSGWGIIELDVDNLDQYPEAFWSIVTTIQYGTPSFGYLPWDTATRTVLRGGRYWHMKECSFSSHISLSDAAFDFPVSCVLRYIIKHQDDKRFPDSITLHGEMPNIIALSDDLKITVDALWPDVVNQHISTLRLTECQHYDLTTLQQMPNLKHLFINLPCPLAITTILATQPKLQSLHMMPDDGDGYDDDDYISTPQPEIKHIVTVIVNHNHINDIRTFSNHGGSKYHKNQSIIELALKYRAFVRNQLAIDHDCLCIIAEYLFGFDIQIHNKIKCRVDQVTASSELDTRKRRFEESNN